MVRREGELEKRRQWKTKGTVGLRWTGVRGAKSGFVQAPGQVVTAAAKRTWQQTLGLTGRGCGQKKSGLLAESKLIRGLAKGGSDGLEVIWGC